MRKTKSPMAKRPTQKKPTKASTSRNSTPKKGVKTRKPTTKNWQKAFLSSLRATGNISVAAQAARIDRKTAYNLKDSDTTFAEEWRDAVDEAADGLEAEARRRAVKGVVEPIYYKGKKIGKFLRYSDTLLIFLLKGARPETYRERMEVIDWQSEAIKAGINPHALKEALTAFFAQQLAGQSDSRGVGGSEAEAART